MSNVVFAQQKKKEEALSLLQQCERIIDYLSFLLDSRKKYIEPLLEYYSDGCDPLVFTRVLLRQGGALCEILNVLKGNILPDPEEWTDTPIQESTIEDLQKHRVNVERFLAACISDMYMRDEQLFSIDSLFKDDNESLAGVTKVVLNLLKRISTVGKVKFVKLLKEEPEENHISSRIKPIEEEVDSEGKIAVKPGTPLGHIVNELIETERIYVTDMARFQLQKREAILSGSFDEGTVLGIFMNIDEVLEFQRGFLIEMEKRLRTLYINDMNIGGLFVENSERFDSYLEFCSGYANACQMVRREEDKLKNIGEFGIDNPVREFDSYLIKPMQRICKYPLILREIYKALPEDSEERGKIKDAMDVVARITASVNEFQRVNENILKADDIYEKIEDKSVCEVSIVGSLKLDEKTKIKSEGITHDYYCILYERRLVFLKEKQTSGISLGIIKRGEGYTVKKTFELDEIDSIEIPEGDESQHILRFTSKKDTTVVLEMLFNTKESLKRWEKTLSDTRAALIESKIVKEIILIKGGYRDEFYVLGSYEKNNLGVRMIKNDILEVLKDETRNTVCEKVKNLFDKDLTTIGLKIKDEEGDWINIITREDLEQLINGRKEVKFSLFD
eukprot:GHVP01000074.1.p1 GENE.GHVP01000074.1~~GHVP01000074.1.p1  ORF type:complete len:618 (-),score=130.27 GHVP01000074.1:84-1937(-)